MSAPQPAPAGTANKRFNVVITGAIRPGFDMEQVRKALAQIAHIDLAKAAELLNGKPRIIKSNVDQSTATQFQLRFEAIGIKCAVRPVQSGGVETKQVTAPKVATRQHAPLTIQTLHPAFDGEVKRHQPDSRYRMGIAAVAIAMVLLPAFYVALVISLGYASVWHAFNDFGWLGKRPVGLWVTLYLGLAVGGLVAAAFMLKPVFAPSRPSGWPIKLARLDDPLFFAFVDEIAERVGAPSPIEIHIDCHVNASASANGGFLGLMKNELILTVGLPLIGGLTARQLAGVVAHELGHFSQSSGMRFGYIVDSINHWLARCVYERDAWDDRLENLANEYDDFRGQLLRMSKGIVWLSRKSLSGAMYLGVLISRYMSRQMEFDADRYAVQVAGSIVQQVILERVQEFDAAREVVFRRLSYNWNDARLSDNFPRMIIEESTKLPERYRDAIRSEMEQEEASLWSTHPTPRERIAKATELNAPGIFASELAATVLLPRYERLCKQASLFHYRHVFGLAVTAEQLVNSTPPPQADQASADEEHFSKYFGSHFSELRFITIKRQAAFAVPDLKETRNRIEAMLRDLQPILKEHEVAIKKYASAHDNMLCGLAASQLASDGTSFDPYALRVAAASKEAAEEALASARQDIAALEPALSRFENLMGQRMEAAFGTRLDSATQNTLTQLIQAMATLMNAKDAQTHLRSHVRMLEALNPTGNELTDTAWDRYATLCISNYDKLLASLGATPYPFVLPEGPQTIADVVQKQCGTSDSLRELRGGFVQKAKEASEILDDLHRRIVARLSAIATHAEAELGVSTNSSDRPPVPAAAPVDPDVPDDKLPY